MSCGFAAIAAVSRPPSEEEAAGTKQRRAPVHASRLLLAGWLLPFNQLLDSFNGWRTTATPVPEKVKDIAHQEDLSDGKFTEEVMAIETDPVETIYQPQDDTVYSDWARGDVSPVTDTTSVQTTKLAIQDELFEDHQVQQPAGQTGAGPWRRTWQQVSPRSWSSRQASRQGRPF